jgi:hypothetical protein
MLNIKEQSQRTNATNFNREKDDLQLEASIEPEGMNKKAIDNIVFNILNTRIKAEKMSRQMLWKKIRVLYPDYTFKQFFENYDDWLNKHKTSTHKTYTGGDTLFINCVSPEIQVINPNTGKPTKVIVFIAMCGASGYSFVEVFEQNDTESALMAYVNALNFFGGVPRIITAYQQSSFGLNLLAFKKGFSEFVEYYNINYEKFEFNSKLAKHNIPISLQVITRWLLYYIHKECTSALEDLNNLTNYLSSELNNKNRINPSREILFKMLDKPKLKSLPQKPYEFFHHKKVKSNIDQHVKYKNHNYSIPCWLTLSQGTELEVRANAKTVNIYKGNSLIARHTRKTSNGGYSTMKLHMPSHLYPDRNYYSKSFFMSWANLVGDATTEIIEYAFYIVHYPQHAYLRCYDILNLSYEYNNALLENVCQSYLNRNQVHTNHKDIEKSIKSIVKTTRFVK